MTVGVEPHGLPFGATLGTRAAGCGVRVAAVR